MGSLPSAVTADAAAEGFALLLESEYFALKKAAGLITDDVPMPEIDPVLEGFELLTESEYRALKEAAERRKAELHETDV